MILKFQLGVESCKSDGEMEMDKVRVDSGR